MQDDLKGKIINILCSEAHDFEKYHFKLPQTIQFTPEQVADILAPYFTMERNRGDLVNRWDAIRLISGYKGVVDKSVAKRLLMQMDGQPEIIRCKDCKNWMPYDWMFSEVWRSQNSDDYSEDEFGCNYCDMSMGANDYCSRADRRTDD